MRLTILATLVTLTALSPAAVAQTRFTVVPTLSIAGIYDDNIFAETEGSAGRMLQLRPKRPARSISRAFSAAGRRRSAGSCRPPSSAGSVRVRS
jgi:hypothetical protein